MAKTIRSRVVRIIHNQRGANATSTGSGGGASVVRASGLVNVTSASHGQADGDHIKIDSATALAESLERSMRNILSEMSPPGISML